MRVTRRRGRSREAFTALACASRCKAHMSGTVTSVPITLLAHRAHDALDDVNVDELSADSSLGVVAVQHLALHHFLQ